MELEIEELLRLKVEPMEAFRPADVSDGGKSEAPGTSSEAKEALRPFGEKLE